MTIPHHDIRENEIDALEREFLEFSHQILDAITSLIHTGVVPSEDVFEQQEYARELFADLNGALVRLAAKEELGSIPRTNGSGSLSQSRDLLRLIGDARVTRTRREIIEKGRKVLESVLNMAHRNQPEFAPLQHCQVEARHFKKTIARFERSANNAENHPSPPFPGGSDPRQGDFALNLRLFEKLLGEIRRFSDLLTLVTEIDTIEDSRWRQLQESVAKNFGESLDRAVARGMIFLSPDRGEFSPQSPGQGGFPPQPESHSPNAAVAEPKPEARVDPSRAGAESATGSATPSTGKGERADPTRAGAERAGFRTIGISKPEARAHPTRAGAAAAPAAQSSVPSPSPLSDSRKKDLVSGPVKEASPVHLRQQAARGEDLRKIAVAKEAPVVHLRQQDLPSKLPLDDSKPSVPGVSAPSDGAVIAGADLKHSTETARAQPSDGSASASAPVPSLDLAPSGEVREMPPPEGIQTRHDREEREKAALPGGQILTAASQMRIRDRFISLCETSPDIPAFSGTARKLLEVSSDQYVSIGDIVQVVKLDPGLTSKYLRLANSVAFGGDGLTDISDALLRLGFEEIRRLAAGVSVLERFSKLRVKLDWNLFWLHSLFTGRMTEHLFHTYQPTSGNEYVAGLLHDMGKLFLGHYFPREFHAVISHAADSKCSMFNAEKQMLDITHPEIGSMLCEKWKFPEEVIHSIRYHHDPGSMPEPEEDTSDHRLLIATCICVADSVANLGNANILCNANIEGGKNLAEIKIESTPEWARLQQFTPRHPLEIDLISELRKAQDTIDTVSFAGKTGYH